MRINAVAIATLLLFTVASSAQDVAVKPDVVTGQDVVVIGRRMRLVRLDYALNGPHLRRCDVEVSSGNPRIDRIMCAVLRRCITAGYHEPRPAKRCMDASIDLVVSGKRRAPEPDVAGAMISTPPSPSTSAQKTVYTPPAAPSGSTPDIVVAGERYKPAGGQWQFTRLTSTGIGRPSQSHWGRCIPDASADTMLRMMLNGEKIQGDGRRCGAMKLKVDLGRVTGNRSCITFGDRMKTLVRGSVGQDQLLVDETTYLVASVRSHEDDPVRAPEDDNVAKVYGQRVGNCPIAHHTENAPQ